MPQRSNSIDRWWREFELRARDLNALFENKSHWDLPQWMKENLNAVHPKIFWEFGPGLKEGHRLVITPESHRHLRPIVETILDRAPTVKGWSFHPYRLAESVSEAQTMVEHRVKGSLKGCTVRADPGKHHRINLTYYWPPKSFNAKTCWNAAFVATETILGEEVLDKWIDRIEAEADGKGMALERLKPTVDTLIQKFRNDLGNIPLCDAEERAWTLWELKPKERPDYPHQWDLFVGKSMLPEMWQNAHNNETFFSSSYSNCGERFCYVKLDGSVGLDQEKFADKAEIEDALEAALKPERSGCVVGGGTGRRYSYIDLALFDLTRGIEQVRKILREGNVPKRSWIQFFDSEWEQEWVGIWDDSPPPPMPKIDED